MYPPLELLTLPTAGEAKRAFRQIAQDKEARQGRMVDKPLALYGAGSLGRMAKEYFDRLGIPVEFVVDAKANLVRDTPFWSGVKVVGPEDVTPQMQEGTLLAVCIATSPYTPIERELHGAGWPDIVPFYDIAESYRDRHPLSNGWFAQTFSPEEHEETERALEMWSDDISRAHHLQFMAWRRLRQEWSFPLAPVNISNRFFIPEVLNALGPDERFLDAGAHLGFVTKAFIDHVNGSFAKIWAIEPDRTSLAGFASALSGLSSEQREKVEVFPFPVGKEPTTARFFEGLDYASQCSPLGQAVFDCRTIDSLDINPSFMKLHLEGMELDALEGARNTIERHRPVITATSYHNANGLWRLPNWLADHLDRYSILMRLHAWCGTGATVYAIPRERAG